MKLIARYERKSTLPYPATPSAQGVEFYDVKGEPNYNGVDRIEIVETLGKDARKKLGRYAPETADALGIKLAKVGFVKVEIPENDDE